MTYERALTYFDGVKGIAHALNLTESQVYSWKKPNRIPEKHVIQLHLKSGGVLPIDPEDYRKEGVAYPPMKAPDRE